MAAKYFVVIKIYLRNAGSLKNIEIVCKEIGN